MIIVLFVYFLVFVYCWLLFGCLRLLGFVVDAMVLYVLIACIIRFISLR